MRFSPLFPGPALGSSVWSAGGCRLLGLRRGGHLEQGRALIPVLSQEVALPGQEQMLEAKATSLLLSPALDPSLCFVQCLPALRFEVSGAGGARI